MLDTPGWHTSLARALEDRDVFFVGLQIDPKLLVEREAARSNRARGSAVRDHEIIHDGLSYDLVLDGACDPVENSDTLLSAWTARDGPSGFFDVREPAE